MTTPSIADAHIRYTGICYWLVIGSASQEHGGSLQNYYRLESLLSYSVLPSLVAKYPWSAWKEDSMNRSKLFFSTDEGKILWQELFAGIGPRNHYWHNIRVATAQQHLATEHNTTMGNYAMIRHFSRPVTFPICFLGFFKIWKIWFAP